MLLYVEHFEDVGTKCLHERFHHHIFLLAIIYKSSIILSLFVTKLDALVVVSIFNKSNSSNKIQVINSYLINKWISLRKLLIVLSLHGIRPSKMTIQSAPMTPQPTRAPIILKATQIIHLVSIKLHTNNYLLYFTYITPLLKVMTLRAILMGLKHILLVPPAIPLSIWLTYNGKRETKFSLDGCFLNSWE